MPLQTNDLRHSSQLDENPLSTGSWPVVVYIDSLNVEFKYAGWRLDKVC